WLINQLAPDMPETQTAPAAQATGQNSWIFDHLEAAAPTQIDFSADFILHERISVEVEFQRSSLGALEPLFPAFALVRLLQRYPRYPLVAETANLAWLVQLLDQQLLEAKARRKTLSRMIVEMDRRYQREVRTLEAKIAEL